MPPHAALRKENWHRSLKAFFFPWQTFYIYFFSFRPFLRVCVVWSLSARSRKHAAKVSAMIFNLGVFLFRADFFFFFVFCVSQVRLCSPRLAFCHFFGLLPPRFFTFTSLSASFSFFPLFIHSFILLACVVFVFLPLSSLLLVKFPFTDIFISLVLFILFLLHCCKFCLNTTLRRFLYLPKACHYFPCWSA